MKTFYFTKKEIGLRDKMTLPKKMALNCSPWESGLHIKCPSRIHWDEEMTVTLGLQSFGGS